MDNHFPIQELAAEFKKILDKAPGELAIDAVNFFVSSFDKQGWQGATFQKWVKREPISKWGVKDDTSRAILIGKGTAHLKRDIRVKSHTSQEAIIGTSLPYARAHNEGFKGPVTQTVRPFTRKNGQQVKSFSRTIQQNIPKRQYMGESPVLTDKLTRILTESLTKAFNK